MVTIQAAVSHGDGHQFAIEELELDDPRDDEVLVRVAGVGICHTDLRIAENATAPIVLGHEGAGVVEAVGNRIVDFVPGDRVIMTYRSCGRCRNCLTGHPALCTHSGRLNFAGRRADGSAAIRTRHGDPVGSSFFGQSSFASLSLAVENNLVRVPDAVPDELLPILGPLGCGIQTGAGAILNCLAPEPGSVVVIAGGGGVGLSAVLGAQLAGAAQIIVVDVVPDRLTAAADLGATATIDGRTEDVVARVRELTGGDGADQALDTSANMTVVGQLLRACRLGGSVGVLGGSQPGTQLAIDYRDFYTNGRTLKGILQGDSMPQLFIPMLIDQHLRGRFPFDRLIRRYPFADFGKAVSHSIAGTTVKAVVTF
jgi:aryl-alcohol dehydrogenase